MSKRTINVLVIVFIVVTWVGTSNADIGHRLRGSISANVTGLLPADKYIAVGVITKDGDVYSFLKDPLGVSELNEGYYDKGLHDIEIYVKGSYVNVYFIERTIDGVKVLVPHMDW